MSRSKIIENIVERARDIRKLEAERSVARAALLDVTIEYAMALAANTCVLVDQNHEGLKGRQKIVRKMRSEWKAIAKGVKQALGDHPICERHLYVVLACYHSQLLDLSSFNQELTGEEQYALGRYMSAQERRQLLRQILFNF